MTLVDELTNWTESYLKNKDLLAKSISSIQHDKDGWTLEVIKKEGVQLFLIIPHLESAEQITEHMREDTNACLVVLNTQANLDIVVKQWSKFVKFPKLCIIFANPKSSTEKRWVVSPYTHDKITERKHVKKGLEALFWTVEPYVKK